jgi:hypothetical protein
LRKINFQDFCDLGGGPLLRDQTLEQLLVTTYPSNEWLPWKFAVCPRNYWDDEKNQKKFMEWATKELKIREMSDWYNVTYKVTLPQIKFLLKTRISARSVERAFYESNIDILYMHYFLLFTLTTNGCHGNSSIALETGGTIRKIKKNSWIGQPNSFL